MDPKDKCQYLKELGLCTEGEKHPEVRRRCQETCGLCEWCVDCIPRKLILHFSEYIFIILITTIIVLHVKTM